jgi:1-acyl-sn-glycerol-3-phosphate acyltransferase
VRRQWLRLRAADARRVLAGAVAGVRAVLFAAWVGVLLAMTLPLLWTALRLARGRQGADAATRRFCRTLLRLAGCGPVVHGLEHLPRGHAIYVANHASYVDVLALLAALPVDLRFVAKRELRAAPIVGPVLRKGSHLTVERVDVSRSVADVEQVSATLRAGASICLFPEGTFGRRAGLLPFRLGAFKAAVETGCPVVPVGIRGTRAVLPADAWRPRPGRIAVTVTPPLHVEGEGWREMVRLRDAARAAIAASGGEAE